MSLQFQLFYKAPPRLIPKAESGADFLVRVSEPFLVDAEELPPPIRQHSAAYSHCVELCVEGNYEVGFAKLVGEVNRALQNEDAAIFDLQTGEINTKDT